MSSPLPPAQQRIGLPWPELNDGLAYKDVISSSELELTTVSDFYSTKYKSSAPLLGWIQRIQNGQIQIDGEIVKDPNTLLRIGSKLVYHRLPWKEPDTPYSLEILYEDDDLIALNKPSGLQVLPGGFFQQRTLLTQLQWCFGQNNSSIGSRESPHPVPVHRLGRGTSGILLCAKTKLAKTKLAAYFAEGTSLVGSGNLDQECGTGRKISKIYRALADGIVEEDEVVIEQPIGVVWYPGVAKGLYVASTEGKPALSKVYVLERDRQRDCTLVKVEIQSGRPHQIRIHLAYIGHPLVGDPLYVPGGQPKCFDPDVVDAAAAFAQDGGYRRPNQAVPGDCGYHLHAHQVELPNLLNTHKVVKIVAPLPPILQTSSEGFDYPQGIPRSYNLHHRFRHFDCEGNVTCTIARSRVTTKEPFLRPQTEESMYDDLYNVKLPDWPSEIDFNDRKRFHLHYLSQLEIVQVAIETIEYVELLNAKTAIVYIAYKDVRTGHLTLRGFWSGQNFWHTKMQSMYLPSSGLKSLSVVYVFINYGDYLILGGTRHTKTVTVARRLPS
ncbi:RNA pseudouridine synthase 5 [Cardamine amara subsp. amara]|uniref:RNA pseudouridine synthase 5 n=1 Tax=Cardamine amara subsp. amara TaxID=228776 RepID=A0ABD0ZZ11_CARAN